MDQATGQIQVMIQDFETWLTRDTEVITLVAKVEAECIRGETAGERRTLRRCRAKTKKCGK